MENRRLIAFLVLSIGTLMLWGYLFPPPKPQRPTTLPSSMLGKKTLAKKARPSSRPSSLAASRPTLRPASSRPASLAASKPTLPSIPTKILTYKHALAHFELSNQGGSVTSLVLPNFRDPASKVKKPLQLIRSPQNKDLPSFVETFLDKSIAEHPYVSYGEATSPKPGTFRFLGTLPTKNGGSLQIEKTITFVPQSYHFSIAYKLTNRSSQALTTEMALQLRDTESLAEIQKSGGFFSIQDTFDVLCKLPAKNSPERKPVVGLKKLESHTERGEISYIAIDRRYFMMALIPQWGSKDLSTACNYRVLSNETTQIEVRNKGVHLKPEESHTFAATGFFGPKYYKELLATGSAVETSIDFGMFAFISKPMLWTMQYFYRTLGNISLANWGIAIILLTLLVKILLLWPTHASMLSMKKMQRLKPELDRIKAKYGDDKESFQREMMALYAREGVNPFGGCLPMLIQMPIWIALYNTLLYSVELYQAPFIPMWIEDLSTRDPFYILPAVLGLAMIAQQRLNPTTGMDEAQAKMMMWFLPIFFTAIMLFLPAGLCLYILVNTVLGILHQWYVYQQPDKPADPKKVQKQGSGMMARMNEYIQQQKTQSVPSRPQTSRPQTKPTSQGQGKKRK